MPDRASGNEKSECVDRIGGAGRQDDIAGRCDRLRQIGKAFLGPERDDDFGIRVEIDIEAAFIVARLGLAQAGNPARGRIAICMRLVGRIL